MPHSYSTSTILDATPERVYPFYRSDKYGRAESEDAFLALRVDPGQIASEKYLQMPNKYLPIEPKAFGYFELGYHFSPETRSYFQGMPEDSMEKDLYLTLSNFIEVAPKNTTEEEYATDQIELLKDVGEYFLTYANNTNERENPSLPEEIKALRRTAMSLYKTARLNQLHINRGANKVAIKPPQKADITEIEDLELYDTLFEQILPPSNLWDGKIPHIKKTQLLKIRERKWLEKPTKIRISNIEYWDLDNKYSEHYSGFATWHAHTDTYIDINHMRKLKAELPEPSVLPEIYSKHIESERKAFYVEYIPNPLYGDNPEENAKRTLSVAKLIQDLDRVKKPIFDIKPSNFRTRKDGSIVITDLGSIKETNGTESLTPKDLEGTEFNHTYASPELLVSQRLYIEDLQDKSPNVNISKTHAYSLGAMLFKSQFPMYIKEETESPGTMISYDTLNQNITVIDADKTIINGYTDFFSEESEGETTYEVEANNISRVHVLSLSDKTKDVSSNPFFELILDSLEPDPKARITTEEFIQRLEEILNSKKQPQSVQSILN